MSPFLGSKLSNSAFLKQRNVIEHNKSSLKKTSANLLLLKILEVSMSINRLACQTYGVWNRANYSQFS